MVLSQQNLDDVRRFLELHAEIDALDREMLSIPNTRTASAGGKRLAWNCKRMQRLQTEYRSLLGANAHLWACMVLTAWKDQQRFLAAFREVNELARTLEAHDPAPILNRIAEVQP